jgi:hypothetical protein
VATYSTDISVTWNGTPFVEVQELAYNYWRQLATGRAVACTLPIKARVSVTCLGTANIALINFGTRARVGCQRRRCGLDNVCNMGVGGCSTNT